MPELDLGTTTLSDQILAYFREHQERIIALAESKEVDQLLSTLAAFALMHIGAESMFIKVAGDDDTTLIREAVETVCEDVAP